MRMRDRNPEISLMPEFDSEEAFNSNFAKETAAVAPYRDSQGRLVLDDIHDLPKVVEKVFAGYPEFTHTFFLRRLSKGICISVRVVYNKYCTIDNIHSEGIVFRTTVHIFALRADFLLGSPPFCVTKRSVLKNDYCCKIYN